jgi:hypothetical protein
MVPSLFFIMLAGYDGYRWCQVWGESEQRKKILKISFYLASAHAGEEGEQCGLKRHCFGFFFWKKKGNEFDNNSKMGYDNNNKLTQV